MKVYQNHLPLPSIMGIFNIVISLSVLSKKISAYPLWSEVCTQDEVKPLPFCNTTKNLNERINDYIKRIPIESKISMMSNYASGYEKLYIPPYQWWSEGLHGPREPCVEYKDTCACPTSFPSPSAMGNAFNRTLYRLVGRAIGIEGRAISNLRKHNMGLGDGLTYWSPTINMQRDPRWGRNQEVPGEDPFLTSQYSKEFVHGLQETTNKKPNTSSTQKLQMASCCKHFIANSLEHWGNVSRHNFNAKIDEEDLHNYYLPPFQECAKHSVCVMCSENAINGIPSCTNPWLLKKVLREDWNFKGYLVTDCASLSDVIHGHHYAKDEIQASAMAKNATVDINCGNTFKAGLLKAYKKGQVMEKVINKSFERIARIQFRLGLFDTPKNYNPLKDIALIGSSKNQRLANEAALQSIVLLKNDYGILPLDKSENRSMAIIGPHLNATEALLSNYHGAKCNCRSDGKMDKDFSCVETPLQAIKNQVRFQFQLHSIMGCNISEKEDADIEGATKLAQESDIVLLFVGLDQTEEREGLDRYETTLPGLQIKLMESILDVAGNKTVVVLIHGGSVSLGESRNKAGAILSAGYGGQAASTAIASVIFGEYNPTGKLSATIYPPSFVHELPLTEMGLRVGVGRTHMYYQGMPEFPFGHGLSYSQWKIDWMDNITDDSNDENDDFVSTLKLQESSSIKLQVLVQNLGPHVIGSSQTILLFWRPCNSASVERNENNKIKQKLIDFQKTRFLTVRQSDMIELQVDWKDFALWDSSRNSSLVLPGSYELLARVADVHITRHLEIRTPNVKSDHYFDMHRQQTT